jgi:hypothetical protein
VSVAARRAALTVVGAIAAAATSWWATGVVLPTLEEPGSDHWVEPIELTRAAETLIGVASLTVLAVCVTILARTTAGQRRRCWTRAMMAIWVGAGYLGAAHRVASAPVSGANIGGAGLVLAAPVMLAMLVGWVLLTCWPPPAAETRHRRPRP